MKSCLYFQSIVDNLKDRYLKGNKWERTGEPEQFPTLEIL